MNIRRRFLIAFVGFVSLISIILCVLAINFIKEAFQIFALSNNPDFILILQNRLFIKVVISFLGVVIGIIICLIPFGIYFARIISNPYLKILDKFSKLAQSRFKVDDDDLSPDEQKLLNQYYNVLVSDFEKIKEYEKVCSWKDGARFLLHEIKNPLTSIKLSTESLLVQSADHAGEEIKRIYAGLSEFENVLNAFKELVAIEFRPKEKICFQEFLVETNLLIEHKKVSVQAVIPQEKIYFDSEPTLLRMIIINLINNGLEANNSGFFVKIYYDLSKINFEFITPNKNLENVDKIFDIGVSSKGRGRGYGLFICRKIAEYLDVKISAQNKDKNIVFKVEVPCTSE
jgi:nitrogen fixation/metabolism regulation signal transduction histidine kinase